MIKWFDPNYDNLTIAYVCTKCRIENEIISDFICWLDIHSEISLHLSVELFHFTSQKPFHAIKTENHKDSSSYDYSNPLTLEKIGLYAKQVLLGVIFLHKLGYPLQKVTNFFFLRREIIYFFEFFPDQCYLWLHAGNVMVKQGICMLSGFEIELLRIKSKDSLSDEANQRCGLNVVGMSTAYCKDIPTRFIKYLLASGKGYALGWTLPKNSPY